MSSDTFDVAVIGAGLSGLCAARRIVGAGRSAVVLEAQPRVGGRMLREEVDLDGARHGFDLGAGYLGSNQAALIQLCTELGFRMDFDDPSSDVVPVRAEGDAVTYLDGKRTLDRPDADIPLRSLGVLSLLGLGVMLLRLNHFVDVLKQHVRAPWEAPDAERWDSWSVEDFLKSDLFFTARDEEMLRIAVRAIWSVEPAEMSFLYFLWYAATAGSITTLTDNQGKGAAQGYFFRNGAQRICERLAADLGAAVRLGQPIRRLEQDGDGVTLLTRDGARVRAGRAIVAASPFVSSRIDYEPPLPAERAQLVQRMPMGRTLKCIAVYDAPFWHDRYSGLAIGNTTPVIWTMDHTVPPGPPAMMAFVVGDRADALSGKPAAAIQEVVCASLAEIFVDDRFLQPRRFLLKDWSADPWSWGGPTGVPPPGALTAFGRALRRPFGRVHWSGTEAATAWAGYMSGAVSAGFAAADEALADGRGP